MQFVPGGKIVRRKRALPYGNGVAVRGKAGQEFDAIVQSLVRGNFAASLLPPTDASPSLTCGVTAAFDGQCIASVPLHFVGVPQCKDRIVLHDTMQAPIEGTHGSTSVRSGEARRL